MPVHERFEELCALATSGTLAEEEWAELDEHLENCPHCREVFSDFEELYLMLATAADIQLPSEAPAGMTGRFLARARAAGIPLAQSPKEIEESNIGHRFFHITPKHILWSSVAIVVIVACVLFAGIRIGTKRKLPVQVQAPPSRQSPVPVQTPKPPIEASKNANDHLRALQEQLRNASTQLQDKQRALDAAKSEIASLSDQLTQLRASNSTLQDDAARRDAKIQQLEAELAQSKNSKNDATTALLADEEAIRRLRGDLRTAQDLNETLSEAHDFIVDRNVHVLNVLPEVDDSSKSPQPRGRIFYTEGKKLVFYAYDLTDPRKINAKASFYLWGERPSVQHVVSLGKFQIDSQEQGRWVLRVTDPQLLANVNSVFVTLELDKGNVSSPSGKRMLSRLLESKVESH